MSWTPPVVNRNNLVKTYLNADDLTRIENNTLYLTDELNKSNYDIKTNTRAWVRENIPTKADIKRICDNITAISNLYFKPKKISVSDPEYKIWNENLNWEHINDLEEDLQRFKIMLSEDVHCNTYENLKTHTYLELMVFSNIQLRRAVLQNENRKRMLPDGTVVRISNKGTYSAGTMYGKYDYVVSMQGNGFLAKQDNIRIAPPDASIDSPEWQPWTW